MKKVIQGGIAVAALIGLGFWMSNSDSVAQDADTVLPELSELEQFGQTAFEATCAACHGIDLQGTENGPPFLHQVYVKGHHGDMAFVLAAKNGARAHHWRFGDMPAQPDVSDEELGAIITYVRKIQAANGF